MSRISLNICGPPSNYQKLTRIVLDVSIRHNSRELLILNRQFTILLVTVIRHREMLDWTLSNYVEYSVGSIQEPLDMRIAAGCHKYISINPILTAIIGGQLHLINSIEAATTFHNIKIMPNSEDHIKDQLTGMECNSDDVEKDAESTGAFLQDSNISWSGFLSIIIRVWS